VHPFQETIGVVGGIAIVIVGAIVFLTLFFRANSWLSRGAARPEAISIRGILGTNTFATVHMVGGQSFDRVRLIGFTRAQDMKVRLPYELNGMVILEDEQHQRYIPGHQNDRRPRGGKLT
jgi:hypothetical protein